MKVVSVPGRLRLATASLFLSIPLLVLEVVLMMRAPWWDLPYDLIVRVAAIAACLVLPVIFLLHSGKKWMLTVLGAIALFWCFQTVVLSFRLKHFWLGVYVYVLALYWVVVWSWIKSEMSRSFFDAKVAWYQGIPRPIPGLQCRLSSGDQRDELRVSRLDRMGAFLFSGRQVIGTKERFKNAEYEFTYKGLSIRCGGKVVGKLDGGQGFGVKFSKMEPDQLKELGDFVERLNGEGYA